MSIESRVRELVVKVRAGNMAQMERVSGVGYSTLQQIKRTGAIGNVSTAVTLEQAFAILDSDPHRGRVRGGPPV